MLGIMSTLLDISTSGVGELGIPNQVLSAVETTPVPVGAHHGADEVGIVLMGSGIVSKGTGLVAVAMVV